MQSPQPSKTSRADRLSPQLKEVIALITTAGDFNELESALNGLTPLQDFGAGVYRHNSGHVFYLSRNNSYNYPQLFKSLESLGNQGIKIIPDPIAVIDGVKFCGICVKFADCENKPPHLLQKLGHSLSEASVAYLGTQLLSLLIQGYRETGLIESGDTEILVSPGNNKIFLANWRNLARFSFSDQRERDVTARSIETFIQKLLLAGSPDGTHF